MINELNQKIKEIKVLLNKEEANENNGSINFNKNLFDISGTKLFKKIGQAGDAKDFIIYILG